MSPRVTLGVATYERDTYLHDAVASCLRQTYGDLEVLVVLDGATNPRVEEVLAGFDDLRLRVVRHDLRPPSGHRRGAWRGHDHRRRRRAAGTWPSRDRHRTSSCATSRASTTRWSTRPAWSTAASAWRGDDDLSALLQAWTQAPEGACLYLLADPGTDGEPAELETRVLAAADGIDLDRCADIAVCASTARPAATRLRAAANAYVPLHAACAGHVRMAKEAVLAPSALAAWLAMHAARLAVWRTPARPPCTLVKRPASPRNAPLHP
jgi:hypothetical protein